jgi:hypothetical protein
MKFTIQRIGAVAGAIGAAILIPAVALAAPGRPAHSAHTTATAVPKCTTGDLRVWVGIPGDGSVQFQLELSNISSHDCTLLGYPGVSATNVGGGQLGSAAGRVSSHPVKQIVLGPAGTAHVELSITDVGNFPAGACHPVTAANLKVFPPNDFTATRIPFSFGACSKRGPVYLHITAAIPGTGIPGFSS